MRKSQFIPLILLCLLFGLSSCTFNNIEEDLVPPTSADPCDSITVSFATDIVPILTSSCSGASLGQCHGAASPRGDFTGYTGTKAKVDGGQFENRVLELKDMPPGFSTGPKSLSAAQMDTIRCWLNDGAPDN